MSCNECDTPGQAYPACTVCNIILEAQAFEKSADDLNHLYTNSRSVKREEKTIASLKLAENACLTCANNLRDVASTVKNSLIREGQR